MLPGAMFLVEGTNLEEFKNPLRKVDSYLAAKGVDDADRTITEQGKELFLFSLNVASGRKKPYTEQ